MTLDLGKQHRRQQRSFSWRLLLIVPIILAIGTIGWLIYDAATSKNNPTTGQSYKYTVDQSLNYAVSYLDNNYFEEASPARSKAYIRDITDKIDTNFSYTFQSDKDANLSYTYATTAHVVATHTPKGEEAEKKVVWDKTYSLTRATSKTGEAGKVSIQDSTAIPYREYSQLIARINNGLALALNAEVTTTFSVTVSGTNKGLPVNEQRTIQLTAPLDQPIYTVDTKYDQHDSKTVTSDSSSPSPLWWQKYRNVIIIILAIVIIGCAVLLMQPWQLRQSERNPYQRELNKIYRYHDGLIIHTQKPLDLKEREVVEISNFDDILSLSEELRVPIIGNKLGPEATRFLIIQDTTIYSYLVGRIATTPDKLPVPVARRKSR